MGNLKGLLMGPGVRFLLLGGSLTVLDLLLFQLLANVLHVSLFGFPRRSARSGSARLW